MGLKIKYKPNRRNNNFFIVVRFHWEEVKDFRSFHFLQKCHFLNCTERTFFLFQGSIYRQERLRNEPPLVKKLREDVRQYKNAATGREKLNYQLMSLQKRFEQPEVILFSAKKVHSQFTP